MRCETKSTGSALLAAALTRENLQQALRRVRANKGAPGVDGLETLARLRGRGCDAAVVMISGHGNIETAVRATKLGAFDFIEKPLSIEKTVLTVRNALRQRGLERVNAALSEEVRDEWVMVGESVAMRALRQQINLVAPTDGRVLIYGESGTGKELVANAIHRLSLRAEGSFIDLNCAAFQESLLESELFGYEAGAFSGAKGRKLGLWELADNGTIFLDEVTELPPQLQSKLLRAIETNSFYRVGAVRKVQVNVRVVAATNRDVNEVTGDGRFRADLLYRINSFQINLPPLRERPDDIEPIAAHLLTRLAGANVPELTQDQVNGRNRLIRNSGVQPEQEWNNEARRMLRRKHIGRAGKDQQHPSYSWHPLTDDSSDRCVQTESFKF